MSYLSDEYTIYQNIHVYSNKNKALINLRLYYLSSEYMYLSSEYTYLSSAYIIYHHNVRIYMS